MKKLFSAIALFSFLVQSCSTPADVRTAVILETDMGNDIDDALALALAYNYVDAGMMDLLAVCINKEGSAPAAFVDIMNTFYGHPEIPVGIIRKGAFCEDGAVNYTKVVADMKDGGGGELFGRSIADCDSLPDAHTLYRKILSSREDKSVVIVSVGFSTNLIKLLETEADGYSPLSGRELVARKVKMLVTMAGDFENPDVHEYNVRKDIPAAKVIFEEWPGPVVTSPFELGIRTCYPASSIEGDFGWAPLNPLVEAYRAYMQMPYDRPMWDPTALLYAVEGDSWFTVSEMGRIKVTDEGSTVFTPDVNGDRRYLSVNPEQAKAIVDHFVELIPAVPANRK